MTMPNSCSMRTSENTSTAKPAIAVAPEASTAAPVERYVRRSARRRRPARALLAVAAVSSTANSVESAITSIPSVADIGFSGTRSANRTSADQPVASAIGTSETHARSAQRWTASSTSPTASSPASSVPSRRHGEASAALASAASTGSPASRAVTPAGGSSASRIRSIARVLLVERHPGGCRTRGWRCAGRR